MKPVAAATNGLTADGNRREAELMEVSAKDPEAMTHTTDPRRIKFGGHQPARLGMPACFRLRRVAQVFSVVVQSTQRRSHAGVAAGPTGRSVTKLC
jgi:hypothetical protein